MPNLTGPFRINVSEVAEKLDYDALSEVQKQQLFQGITYDSDKHDVFRFAFFPEQRDPHPSWNDRQLKKKRFELVDRVLVSVKAKQSDMRFLGMRPTTTTADGQPDLDLEAMVSGQIVGVGKAGLKLTGPIKNWFRRSSRQVVAHRTDRLVNWVYGRRWIDSGSDLCSEVLCVVPRSGGSAARGLSFFADFKDKSGRAVEKVRKVIAIPAG